MSEEKKDNMQLSTSRYNHDGSTIEDASEPKEVSWFDFILEESKQLVLALTIFGFALHLANFPDQDDVDPDVLETLLGDS